MQFSLLINNINYSYSKIGEEQSAEDAEDGPPELLVCFCSGFTTSYCRTEYDRATKTAAVLKSFHLPCFQSIALTCSRLPLFNSERSDFFFTHTHTLPQAVLDMIYSFLMLSIFTVWPCPYQYSSITKHV